LISASVVDTDVISYIFKGDTRNASYYPHLSGKLALISFMTLAELRQWALLRNWGDARRQQLETFSTTTSSSTLTISSAQNGPKQLEAPSATAVQSILRMPGSRRQHCYTGRLLSPTIGITTSALMVLL
jgi:hypothetical protein